MANHRRILSNNTFVAKLALPKMKSFTHKYRGQSLTHTSFAFFDEQAQHHPYR